MTSRLLRLATVVVVLSVVLAPPVRAEDILELGGGVTDTSGVLAGREDEILDAIDQTLDDTRVQVWVLYVETTGDRSVGDYASETAAANSLGSGDALLVVAMEDRTDFIWVSDSLDAITDDELDTIIVDELEPRLRDGDPVGAAIATVQALGQAALSAVPTGGPIVPGPATQAPTQDPGGGGSTDGGGDGDDGIGIGTILAVLAIGGGGFLLWRQWRMRRLAPGRGAAAGTTGTPAPAPIDAKALAQQANALLIATDERIRDAAQETDFAEAQYGSDSVISFRAAVAEAREQLGAAFTIRQRLDDATPEDEPARIAMLQEIVTLTTAAQDRLDAETERIRQLRDLERDAPNTLVELPARIEAVEDRLDAAEARTNRLHAYADAVWGPIRGNLEEARKGLSGARTAVTIGSAAVASDDPADMAVATRTALEGITGAGVLIDAIEQLDSAVADAERRFPAELAEAEQDLADATAALTGRAMEPATDQRRRAAGAALDAARVAGAATPADPVEALRLATEAHRLADEVLLVARDAAAAADRLVAAADSSVRTASAEVDRAATFIASRRRGVGDTARTRLAEAQRHLVEAANLLEGDPARALDAGRRSQALAQEAYRLAQDDFSDWDQGGPGWGQRGGTAGGDQTTAILGQILGGVIGGVLAGGGRSGGGWGGSPWGGSSGGSSGGGLGGGWGGGGGFGSGGFGGGGGGRGRGGRW